MKLAFAQQCAEKLEEFLKPHCLIVQVAGSIRRERPEVNDVDLVAVARVEPKFDLFGAPVGSTNHARVALSSRAQAEKWAVRCDGADIFSATHRGVQVDVFWAKPETFGTILLCRTGAKEHNILVAQWAEARRAKWNPCAGLYELNHRVSESEEEIYAYLGMPWIPPMYREASFVVPKFPLHRSAAFPQRSPVQERIVRCPTPVATDAGQSPH